MNITSPAQQSSGDEVESAQISDEAIIGAGHGQKAEVALWLKNFDMVVVIDKATQSLKAYRNQAIRPAVDVNEVMNTKVSTGEEIPGCHLVRSLPDKKGIRWIEDVIPMTKHTPTGYYVPTEIDADHFSGTYDGSHMKNAVAWDRKNGFWIHEVPSVKKDLDKTGKPVGFQSHGCIRLSPEDSRDLMTMTLMTGPEWSPTNANLRAHCWQNPDVKVPCVPDADRDHELADYLTKIKNNNYPPYSSADRNPDLKSRMPRLSPNGPDQEALSVGKDGHVQMNGEEPVTTRGAYNTLFIVKDSRIEDTETVEGKLRYKSQAKLRVEHPLPVAPSKDECKKQMVAENAELSRKTGGDVPTEIAAKSGQPPQTASVQNPLGDFGQKVSDFFSGKAFQQQAPPTPPQPVRRSGNR